jgi:predicted  nucleic acid-binding Zn-ribbon protein
MGGRDHVERAKNFLAAASNMKGAHEMQRQIETQKDKIATLEAALEQLKAELAANPKRRRSAQEED